ncbi:MAG: acyltransferase family protein [Eubacterium sp.]
MKNKTAKINCSTEDVVAKRIEWIDIAKGIGIILVVTAHTQMPSYSLFDGNNNILRLLIYSFHMPLFFFLSGMCFKTDGITFKEFLTKKIKTKLKVLIGK